MSMADGIQEPDWERLRSAYRESIGSHTGSASGHSARGHRHTKDGGAHRSQMLDGVRSETEKGQGMEHPAYDLSRDLRPSDRRSYQRRTSKGDVDSIATLMAAAVAMILVGTLLARYWLLLSSPG